MAEGVAHHILGNDIQTANAGSKTVFVKSIYGLPIKRYLEAFLLPAYASEGNPDTSCTVVQRFEVRRR
jgi:hypothetical protein